MDTVNIHAAKTHFSRLIERVEAGEEVVVARAGKPVAKIVPFRPEPAPRKLGLMKGVFIIPDDFDDPLPDEMFDTALFPPRRKKKRGRQK
jgi:prevent-host-death family protein